MPSSSAAQHRWIEYVRHNPAALAKTGMSQAKADEWAKADTGKPWEKRADGGVMGSYVPKEKIPPSTGVSASRTLHIAAEAARRRPNAEPKIGALPKPPKLGGGGAVERALNVATAVAGHKPKALAFGGNSSFDMVRPPYMPIQTREAIREDAFGRPGGITDPLGHIPSTIPGRTDRIPASVPADSYVIPADVVSGMGEGNTLAGANLIHKMFTTGPYGLPQQRIRDAGRGVGIPTARAPSPYEAERVINQPEPNWFAKGGKAKPTQRAKEKTPDGADAPRMVPVILAGGEMLVDPHTVKYDPRLGNGDMKHGHAVLDAFVTHARKKIIEEMKKLPGPKR